MRERARTGDESSQWKRSELPKSNKARHVRSNVKVLLTIFSSITMVLVHLEFLPEGRTINKEYYLNIIRHFREAV